MIILFMGICYYAFTKPTLPLVNIKKSLNNNVSVTPVPPEIKISGEGGKS